VERALALPQETRSLTDFVTVTGVTPASSAPARFTPASPTMRRRLKSGDWSRVNHPIVAWDERQRAVLVFVLLWRRQAKRRHVIGRWRHKHNYVTSSPGLDQEWWIVNSPRYIEYLTSLDWTITMATSDAWRHNKQKLGCRQGLSGSNFKRSMLPTTPDWYSVQSLLTKTSVFRCWYVPSDFTATEFSA